MTCAITPGSICYLVVCRESTWGTKPGSPTNVYLPVENPAINMVPQLRESKPFSGTPSGVHAQVVRASPSGTIQVPLYPWQLSGHTKSLAQHIMEWALPTAFDASTMCDFPSMTIEASEGAISDRQFLGMRVGQFQLSGSEQDPGMKMALTLMGKDANALGTPPAAPPDNKNGLQDMQFSDLVLTVDGVETSINNFQLDMNFGMQSIFNSSDRPEIILASEISGSLALGRQKGDSTWDELLCDSATHEYSIVAELRGSHNGTGGVGTTETVLTITLPRCVLKDAPTAWVMNNANTQNLNFVLKKPDTSDEMISAAFTEE